MRWICAVLLAVVALSGCSFVNFSGNYYDLSQEDYSEVHRMWAGLRKSLPLKNYYKYVILSDAEFKKSKGVPAIAGDTVIVPESFLRYIYQNYYDKRTIILTSVIVHELCHREYDLPSTPSNVHFKVDQYAIALLGKGVVSATTYYQSLFVMKNYWFARKGMAGHALNASWNAANVAALALTGHAKFADWFATDLDERMNLIANNYNILTRDCFPRSAGPGV